MTDTEAMDLTAQFREYYRGLVSCCMRAPANEFLEQAAECVAFVESEGDGPSGAAIVRLSGGAWVVFQEWQDYSGHG